MARFTHAGAPEPKTHSPEPMSPEDSEKVQRLCVEIEAADSKHRQLLINHSNDYAQLRKMHLAGALVWSLRATLCYERGEHDAARKASTTANEHATMAHKLEQNSAVDRLTELERLLAMSRQDAGRLAKMK